MITIAIVINSIVLIESLCVSMYYGMQYYSCPADCPPKGYFEKRKEGVLYCLFGLCVSLVSFPLLFLCS